MTESKFRIDEIINNNLSKIIEAFVAFYGESERDNIEKKFHDAEIIGYIGYDDYKYLLNEAQKECLEETEKLFLSSIGVESNSENIEKYFGRSANNFEDTLLCRFFAHVDSMEKFDIKYVMEALKSITSKDDLIYGTEEVIFLISDIKKYKNNFEMAYKYYKDIIEKRYGDKIAYLNDLVSKIEKMEKEEVNSYVAELLPYMDDNDRKIIESSKDGYIPYYKLSNSSLFMKYSFDIKSPMPAEAFNSDSYKILNDPNVSEYLKDNIRRDRMQYFKSIRIDLGEDYMMYDNNLLLKSKTPRKELCDVLTDIRKRHLETFENGKVMLLPHMEDIVKRKDSIKRYRYDDGYINVIRDKSTCVCPNFKKENGENVVSPLVMIPGRDDISSMDARIIHELNHVYELFLTNVDDKKASFICGWDYASDSLTREPCEEDNNKYTMLNEIVNEYIAQDIVTILHNAGVYLFGDRSTTKNSSLSGYEANLKYFTRNFYLEFKDIILKSRKNSMQVIFDELGEDNFNEYAEFISDMNNRYCGFNIYRVLDDIMSNRETDLVREFRENQEKAENMIQKMKDYKNRKNLE